MIEAAQHNPDVLFGMDKYEAAFTILAVAQVINALGLILVAILAGRR